MVCAQVPKSPTVWSLTQVLHTGQCFFHAGAQSRTLQIINGGSTAVSIDRNRKARLRIRDAGICSGDAGPRARGSIQTYRPHEPQDGPAKAKQAWQLPARTDNLKAARITPRAPSPCSGQGDPAADRKGATPAGTSMKDS